jgi:hypothetical protein
MVIREQLQWYDEKADNYAAAIEPLFYFVDDGAVTLCDETGKTSGKTMRVEAGDDPRRVAAMLRRSTMQQESNFNREIHYGPSGVA